MLKYAQMNKLSWKQSKLCTHCILPNEKKHSFHKSTLDIGMLPPSAFRETEMPLFPQMLVCNYLVGTTKACLRAFPFEKTDT